MIKPIFKKLFPSLYSQVVNFQILASRQGQFKSIREQAPIDTKGDPLPWYTYSTIEYLNSFDLRDCCVFEYGSGYSSLYWAKKVKKVISVEDNLEWFNKTNESKGENMDLLFEKDQSNYINSLANQKSSFDIIVIDGSWRLMCAKEAMKFIKEGGLIILDNSDKYPNTAKTIRENGFFQCDFTGFGPGNGYCWTTSVFTKAKTHLQKNFSDPSPIGGLKNQHVEDDH